MKHTYNISGVTCNNCVNKVKELLGAVNGITSVEISPDFKRLDLGMSHHVSESSLNERLKGTKYSIAGEEHAPVMPEAGGTERTTLKTYTPVLLLFAYIILSTLSIQLTAHHFDIMHWMEHFMGGFFLAFSYFKLLDVPAFASSYASYDIIARRWLGYGYIYPFIELALGLLFITGFAPFFTNAATLAVMGISTIGVIISLAQKRKFQCACMGAVFNLPMSTITLIEDLLMVAMSAAMLVLLQ